MSVSSGCRYSILRSHVTSLLDLKRSLSFVQCRCKIVNVGSTTHLSCHEDMRRTNEFRRLFSNYFCRTRRSLCCGSEIRQRMEMLVAVCLKLERWLLHDDIRLIDAIHNAIHHYAYFANTCFDCFHVLFCTQFQAKDQELKAVCRDLDLVQETASQNADVGVNLAQVMQVEGLRVCFEQLVLGRSLEVGVGGFL